MASETKSVVIVGGGTAGWLTASLLAARHGAGAPGGLSVTLVESPDTPAIGVGEGTWPTIRDTLKRIGIPEPDFIARCDASFKQGSRFDKWVSGDPGDRYLHPFVPPVAGHPADIHAAWRSAGNGKPFADTVCAQTEVCAQGLAPRQQSMPDYEGALNYAYHLDAGKFAALLQEHAVSQLGVCHVRDHVTDVKLADNGDVDAVVTRTNGHLAAELFVDCTGFQSLLLGGKYGFKVIEQNHVLFNDAALAVQVPADKSDSIASQTISTAHDAGWIWDIGLQTRRGVGLVYASSFMDDDEATATLERYVAKTGHSSGLKDLSVRKISFRSGYREKFWHRNCVAIGLSAGFLEPLEASAIVMIELSARFLSDNFPKNRALTAIMERRFNELFSYRWGRIIDFLKLHYCLSRRRQPYWQENRAVRTIPDRLSGLMELWRHQPPATDDFPHAEEIFPAASYQYILYGMGFDTRTIESLRPLHAEALRRHLESVALLKRKLVAGLPTNRVLLSNLAANGCANARELGG